MTTRYVLVRADQLDELLQLSGYAVERMRSFEPSDALTEALVGAIAEIRIHSVPEPA